MLLRFNQRLGVQTATGHYPLCSVYLAIRTDSETLRALDVGQPIQLDRLQQCREKTQIGKHANSTVCSLFAFVLRLAFRWISARNCSFEFQHTGRWFRSLDISEIQQQFCMLSICYVVIIFWNILFFFWGIVWKDSINTNISFRPSGNFNLFMLIR